MATFEDTFNRANSNTVGNGWSENELGATHTRILNNTLYFDNSTSAIYRTRTGGYGANNTTIIFSVKQATGGANDAGVYTATGTARGEGGNSFGLRVDELDDTVDLIDRSATVQDIKLSISWDINTTTWTFIRFDVETDYSCRIYIRDGDADFTADDLQATQAAFTPIFTDQGYWGIHGSATTEYDGFLVYDSVQAAAPAASSFVPKIGMF